MSPIPASSRILSLTVAFLIALLMTSGCGTSERAASTLPPTSTASGTPEASIPDPRLLGEWLIEDGATYTITANESAYELAIVDYDGEVFEVRSLTWNEGVLAWTYMVPSTGTRVSEETTRISEDQIEVQWQNSTGNSGVDILNRVE